MSLGRLTERRDWRRSYIPRVTTENSSYRAGPNGALARGTTHMFEPSSSTSSDSPDGDDQLSRDEDHDSDLDRDLDPDNGDENDPNDSNGSNITPRAERDRDERARNQSGIPGHFTPPPPWPVLHAFHAWLKADIATLLQRGAPYVLCPG